MPSPTDRNLTLLPTKTVEPQSRRKARHFTKLDQVTQLVAARDADPDLGFMARLLALCSLPRANPGNRLQFQRVNGPYTLYMVAGGGNKLPYGTLPRLLLAWVCTEAVRTQSPELILGDSLSEFMRKVGIYSTSGDKHTRLRNQMRRLFGCTVSLLYEDARGEATLNAPIARLTEFWWSERQPDARSLWESKIELGEDFFNEIIHCPIPIDMNTLRAMKRSPLGLDLYLWPHLPDVRAQAPAAPHVAATLPAVRRGPGEGEQSCSAGFPPGLSTRVKENQERVAGSALPDGQGGAAALPLAAAHRAVATASRGIALTGQGTSTE